MHTTRTQNFPRLISFYEAQKILQDIPLKPIGVQKVYFKNALNRILAEDIIAQSNIPSLPTAAMDGYAIFWEDKDQLESQGLALLPDNKAGNPLLPTLKRGFAIKTFTGSQMPIDSDTLVIVEHIEERNGHIYLKSSFKASEIKKSQWVRQIGDNYRKGDILLKAGSRIGAFEIGLLAELNQSFVLVRQKVRVGVLCVGDEILEVGECNTQSNFVRSVNTHLLEAIITQMGADAIIYPLLKDDKDHIRHYYQQALGECDIIVSTGGMSMGDYDYTQEIMQELLEIQFKGVRLKPGKPVAFGIKHQQDSNPKLALGLPGFPNSCAVTFYLFGRILIDRLQATDWTPMILQATLAEDVKRNDSRMEFRVCDLRMMQGQIFVSFANKKSLQSSMINNFTQNTALAILPENGANMNAGEKVEVMLLHYSKL